MLLLLLGELAMAHGGITVSVITLLARAKERAADHEVNGGEANYEATSCGAAKCDTSRQSVGV